MSITLNHTIIPSRDKKASAEFFATIFGITTGVHDLGPHATVQVSDDLMIHFDARDNFEPHHYAFRVNDQEFDEILARITKANVKYAGDAALKQVDQINHRDGGRGVYFPDPNSHLLEILTRGESVSVLAARLAAENIR
jgi:catechol 2,3-dioxygenase-like lactoylglutathione lyase family enzyme